MDIVDVDNQYMGKKSRRAILTAWHYTSADGLVGILSERKIRLTDCRFLNDSKEYCYIEELIDELLQNHKLSSYDKEIKRALDQRGIGLYVAKNKPVNGSNPLAWFSKIRVAPYYVLACL